MPLKFLETQVSLEEENLANHEYLWDGDSLPLVPTNIDVLEKTHLSLYGRKYSFSKAVQKIWLELPENVKRWALQGNINKVDGLLTGGLGVQGLIHTADGKILTTMRSIKTINNGGLTMPSFNEGASIVDVDKGKIDIIKMFRRGMMEELNISENIEGVNVNVHSLILDTKMYEWGFLGYVDARQTGLTSKDLESMLTSAEDDWGFDFLTFHDFNPTVINSFMQNTQGWVSHGLICSALSGLTVFPEIEKTFKKLYVTNI